MHTPLIIGHRGAAAVAPENTLMAFERAMADGADGIEFDVRLAHDLVPVVIHDANLKRTALKEGLVTELSSIELNRTDAGTWFNVRFPKKASAEYARATVPTLSEVLDVYKESRALLYIEMKCDARDNSVLASEVARLIRQFFLFDRVVVESFSLAAIGEIKQIDLGIRTAALFEPKLARPFPSARAMIQRALDYGADEIALHRSLATRRALEEATRHGLKTVVWTVDHPSWIARAQRNGISAVITNDPARMSLRRNQLSDGQT